MRFQVWPDRSRSIGDCTSRTIRVFAPPGRANVNRVFIAQLFVDTEYVLIVRNVEQAQGLVIPRPVVDNVGKRVETHQRLTYRVDSIRCNNVVEEPLSGRGIDRLGRGLREVTGALERSRLSIAGESRCTPDGIGDVVHSVIKRIEEE